MTAKHYKPTKVYTGEGTAIKGKSIICAYRKKTKEHLGQFTSHHKGTCVGLIKAICMIEKSMQWKKS